MTVEELMPQHATVRIEGLAPGPVGGSVGGLDQRRIMQRLPGLYQAGDRQRIVGEHDFFITRRLRALLTSEERRGGQGCARTCRSRWAQYPSKKNHTNQKRLTSRNSTHTT